MNTRKQLTYRSILLGLFMIIWILSCLNPRYPVDMMLEHIPTLVTVIVLVLTARRWPFSNVSYTLIFLFMLLHVLGAKHLYSNVPYNDWSESLFGTSINEAFSLGDRNHYDRFVHFAWGLLIMLPAYEVFSRLNVNRFWGCMFAIGFIVFVGAIYEMLEWLVSIVMSPDDASNYNGQQGDIWDAQKDSALALEGAVITAIIMGIVHAIRSKRQATS